MTPSPPRRPRLRTRLALLHAGLAFAGGVVLLAIVDLPLISVGHTTAVPGSAPSSAATTNLPEVLRYSAVALVVLAVGSVALGRLIAGRALRPLTVLTSSARTLSADSLGHGLRVPAATYEEFTELADSLDDLRRRLDDAFTAQRQFVANASHELRTPLTVQRTLLQLALADPDASADTLRATCHDLLAYGRQQEELITALLALAGGYRGIGHRETFDLAALTGKIVADRRAEAALRRVRLNAALTASPVTGDPRLAASLVTNLVDNALRHNVAGGTVDVSTTGAGRLTVSNTGPPVPPAELARLFQPFQRLGTDRTDRTDGHGLGLAIVAAIADAHGAPLTAHSRPDGGLHITVDFPLTHTHPDGTGGSGGPAAA